MSIKGLDGVMKNNSSFLLALDASTATVGFCLYDLENKSIVKLDSLDLSNIKGLMDKALFFEEWLKTILGDYPEIGKMVIEEAFIVFSKGKSSASTVSTLISINALYRYICFKAGLEINTISVSNARSLAYPTYSFKQKAKSGGLNHKEQAFLLVLAELGDSYFPKKIMKSGPDKGKERFEDFCTDRSDAYILAKSFVLKGEGVDPKAIRLANKKRIQKENREARRKYLKKRENEGN